MEEPSFNEDQYEAELDAFVDEDNQAEADEQEVHSGDHAFETGEIEVDQNYEPTDQEYAQYLGFEFPEDQDLIYIAREGLKAPLPEPWKPCRNQEGDIYFFNFETGESIWEHPSDQYFRQLFQQKKKEKEQGPEQVKDMEAAQNIFQDAHPNNVLQADKLPLQEEAPLEPLADELIENSAHFGSCKEDEGGMNLSKEKAEHQHQQHQFTLAQKELVTISDDKGEGLGNQLEFKLYDSDQDLQQLRSESNPQNFLTEANENNELPSDIAIIDGPHSEQNSESLDLAKVFDQAHSNDHNGGMVDHPDHFRLNMPPELEFEEDKEEQEIKEEIKPAVQARLQPPDSQKDQRQEEEEEQEDQEEKEEEEEQPLQEDEEGMARFEDDQDDYYELDLMMQDWPEQLRDQLHMYQANKYLEFKNFYLGLINGMEDRAQLGAASGDLQRPESELQQQDILHEQQERERLAREVEEMQLELEKQMLAEKSELLGDKEERLNKVHEKCEHKLSEAERKSDMKVGSERADLKQQLEAQHQLELQAIKVRYNGQVDVEKMKIQNDTSVLENAAESGPEEGRLKSHRGLIYTRTERLKEQEREQHLRKITHYVETTLARQREEQKHKIELQLHNWLENETRKAERNMQMLQKNQEEERGRIEEQIGEQYMQKMEKYETDQGVMDADEMHDLDGIDSHRERKSILKKKLELEYEAQERELQKQSLESLGKARMEIEEFKLQEKRRLNLKKAEIDGEVRREGLEGQLLLAQGQDVLESAKRIVEEVQDENRSIKKKIGDLNAQMSRVRQEKETHEEEYMLLKGGGNKRKMTARHTRSRPEFGGAAEVDQSLSFVAPPTRAGKIQIPRLPSTGSSALGNRNILSRAAYQQGGMVQGQAQPMEGLGDEMEEEEQDYYRNRVRSAQGRLSKAVAGPSVNLRAPTAVSQNNSMVMQQQDRIMQLEGEVSTLKDLILMQNAMATTLSEQQSLQQAVPSIPPTFGRVGPVIPASQPSLYNNYVRAAPRISGSANTSHLGIQTGRIQTLPMQLREDKRKILFALDECDVELSVLKKVKTAAVEARDNWERERSQNAELPITKSAVSTQMARDYDQQIESAEKQIEAMTKKISDYNQALDKVKDIQKKLQLAATSPNRESEEKSILAELEALRQFKINNKLNTEDSFERSLQYGPQPYAQTISDIDESYPQRVSALQQQLLENRKKVMNDQLSLMSYNQRFYQLYQRNLIAMNRNRENIKSMLSRQLNWISTMKDEVNRTSSSLITARYPSQSYTRLPL